MCAAPVGGGSGAIVALSHLYTFLILAVLGTSVAPEQLSPFMDVYGQQHYPESQQCYALWPAPLNSNKHFLPQPYLLACPLYLGLRNILCKTSTISFHGAFIGGIAKGISQSLYTATALYRGWAVGRESLPISPCVV